MILFMYFVSEALSTSGKGSRFLWSQGYLSYEAKGHYETVYFKNIIDIVIDLMKKIQDCQGFGIFQYLDTNLQTVHVWNFALILMVL